MRGGIYSWRGLASPRFESRVVVASPTVPLGTANLCDKPMRAKKKESRWQCVVVILKEEISNEIVNFVYFYDILPQI